MNANPHAGPNGAEKSLFRIILTVFLPFAGGYFLSYLYRSTNAVIAPQLVEEVGLSAADLGLLTSAYFLAFASFQVPLGVLLDRFGPRRVQSSLLLFAAAGAFVFSIGESKEMLTLGRALIGLGVCGGLMASFKAITLWFPKDRWPLVNGCFLAMGGLGAISATAPLEMALGYADWREIFQVLAGATVVASLVIFSVVPEKPSDTPPSKLSEQIAGLKIIFSNKLFWALAPMTVSTMAVNWSIQTLWAGPWLRDVAGFDRAGVASYLFILATAMTCGFVLTGLVTDFFVRRGTSLRKVILVGTPLFLAAHGIITFALFPNSAIPWIAFGLLANVTALSYPFLNQYFPLEFAGRASSTLNMFAFFGGFLGQSVMGWIIAQFPANDVGGYNPESYFWAFGIMLAIEIVGYFWFVIRVRSVAQKD